MHKRQIWDCGQCMFGCSLEVVYSLSTPKQVSQTDRQIWKTSRISKGNEPKIDICGLIRSVIMDEKEGFVKKKELIWWNDFRWDDFGWDDFGCIATPGRSGRRNKARGAEGTCYARRDPVLGSNEDLQDPNFASENCMKRYEECKNQCMKNEECGLCMRSFRRPTRGASHLRSKHLSASQLIETSLRTKTMGHVQVSHPACHWMGTEATLIRGKVVAMAVRAATVVGITRAYIEPTLLVYLIWFNQGEKPTAQLFRWGQTVVLRISQT